MSQAVKTRIVDTSALVKYFVEEPESKALRRYLDQHGVLSVTSITFAETLGVLKSKWLHKKLTQEEYLAASEDLAASVAGQKIQIDESVSLTDHVTFDKAESFCKRYDLDLADALQLVALKHGFFSKLAGESKTILITADGGLEKAAISEGLRAWNCRKSTTPPY